MNKEHLEILVDILKRVDSPRWELGLLRCDRSGHTREVSELKTVHPGRDSAGAFILGKLTGDIDESHGVEILKAIESLQVLDEFDEHKGAFRWYLEESRPADTNAAFFTLLPLIVLRLYENGCLSHSEQIIIDRMLEKSGSWFLHECRTPILYYTNKIISDGAMLTAIGNLTGNADIIETSRTFLNKWLEYTEKRGFGWGENLSPGYNGVTLQAFAIIKESLDDTPRDKGIRNRFNKIEEGILETFRHFNGHEFVPAIRSYNIMGKPRISSILYNLAGVGGYGLGDGMAQEIQSFDLLSDLAKAIIIYGDRLYLDLKESESRQPKRKQDFPSVKVTHIMDDVKAYSWMGINGGLGSLNRFPVIKGSYQHKTWGLGWQCFPVSAIVYDEQVSFLRFNVNDGVKMRYHPHKDKHGTYLDPALFSEGSYPDVKTACRQADNTLVAIRSIEKLRNKVSSITDSFDIQRFKGIIHKCNIKGRQWISLINKNACICLTPLIGLKAGIDEYEKGLIEIKRDGVNVSLVQSMYKGELKTLFDDRISTGWVIHLIDKAMEKDFIGNYLEKFSIIDTNYRDGQLPRMAQWNIQDVQVKFEGETLVKFIYDPYI